MSDGKTSETRAHEIVLGILYVAGFALSIYRIIKTLDAVFSKAPEIPKDKPMEINAKAGWFPGIHAHITEQNSIGGR